MTGSRRSYAIPLTILVVAALASFWVSPYLAALRFARAANAGNIEAVIARIDLAALRASFARQIVRTYLARNPQAQSASPIARQAASIVVSGYVNAIIGEHLTPELIATWLAGRRLPPQGVAAPPAINQLPSLERLGDAWSLFWASGFTGLTTFAVRPAAAPESNLSLNFGLRGTTWRLISIDLPNVWLSRLADELKAQIDRPS